MELRRALYRLGYRYRIQYPVPGNKRRRIDVAFPSKRLAVFVDGCFWHSCPIHGTSPKANSAWWSEKLAHNVLRDRETDTLLAEAGWKVVRVWEHSSVAESVDLVRCSLDAVR